MNTNLLVIAICLSQASCGAKNEHLAEQAINVIAGSKPRPAVTTPVWENFPISIYIEPSFSQSEIDSIKSAMTTWEKALGKPLFNTEPSKKPNGKILKNFNVEYFHREDNLNVYAYERPIVNNESGYITSAIIDFNTLDFEWTDSMLLNKEASRLADVESVAVHELGHLLGLGHLDDSIDSDSVMNPIIVGAIGYAKRRLSISDIKNINYLYQNQRSEDTIEAIYQNQTSIESITSEDMTRFRNKKNCKLLLDKYGPKENGEYTITYDGAEGVFDCKDFPGNVLHSG
jgi:hypothetical protein